VRRVLREVKDAAFEQRLTPLGRRYHASWDERPAWGSRAFRALHARQVEEPVALHADGRRRWWLFEDRVYWEDDGLAAADVRALVREREDRARRRLERAHAVAALRPGPRRQAIPAALRRAVWERDGGACAGCGSRFDLQYDHVIPVALGGATTAGNLQVLCGDCNRRKGAAIA
jgi:HNH endonuclease